MLWQIDDAFQWFKRLQLMLASCNFFVPFYLIVHGGLSFCSFLYNAHMQRCIAKGGLGGLKHHSPRFPCIRPLHIWTALGHVHFLLELIGSYKCTEHNIGLDELQRNWDAFQFRSSMGGAQRNWDAFPFRCNPPRGNAIFPYSQCSAFRVVSKGSTWYLFPPLHALCFCRNKNGWSNSNSKTYSSECW